jgi:hypothetical protein
MRRCEYSIKVVIKEIWREGLDLIRLDEDRAQRRDFVNTLVNFRIPQKEGNSLTSWVTYRISRIVLHAGS